MPAYKFNPLTGALDGTASSKSDVGLGNVDNTSDANKPVSTATQTALNAKVTGPASSTDNAIARFDGTTGKLVQNSGVVIDDSGNTTFNADVLLASAVDSTGVATVYVDRTTKAAMRFRNGTSGANGYVGAFNPNEWRMWTSTATDLTLGTNNTERLRIGSGGLITANNSIGFGYGTGSGGTVTQATSKSTSVTLNKPSGQITMNNAALAAGASVIFSCGNSTFFGPAGDSFTASGHWGAIDPRNYHIEAWCGYASLWFRVTNVSGGSLSEALQINFAVIKGSTS